MRWMLAGNVPRLERLLACALMLTACGDDVSEPAETRGDAGAETADADAPAVQGDAAADTQGDASVEVDASATGDAATDNAVHFDRVYSEVLVGEKCSVCHPVVTSEVNSLDFSTIDAAYRTLVGDRAAKCAGQPYVNPGKPDDSWLYDLVGDYPGCGAHRMPENMDVLPADKILLLRQWILDGALR